MRVMVTVMVTLVVMTIYDLNFNLMWGVAAQLA
jgi:hypothetical protein